MTAIFKMKERTGVEKAPRSSSANHVAQRASRQRPCLKQWILTAAAVLILAALAGCGSGAQAMARHEEAGKAVASSTPRTYPHSKFEIDPSAIRTAWLVIVKVILSTRSCIHIFRLLKIHHAQGWKHDHAMFTASCLFVPNSNFAIHPTTVA